VRNDNDIQPCFRTQQQAAQGLSVRNTR